MTQGCSQWFRSLYTTQAPFLKTKSKKLCMLKAFWFLVLSIIVSYLSVGEYPPRKNCNIDICFGAGDSIVSPNVTTRKINTNLTPTYPQPPCHGTVVTVLW